MLTSRSVALVVVGQTRGDLVYFNGTEWVRLPTGTVGQVLSTDGDVPQWVTLPPAGSSEKYRAAGTAPLSNAVTLTFPDFFPFTGLKIVELSAAFRRDASYPAVGEVFETLCVRAAIAAGGSEQANLRVVSVENDNGMIYDDASLLFTQNGDDLEVHVVFTAGNAVDYRISFTEA